jgi:hypothetical protein
MPEEEEELQTKPLSESIQRQEMPEQEEEELQTKPLAEFREARISENRFRAAFGLPLRPVY